MIQRSESPRKIPPAVPARNPKTQLSSKTTSRLTMQTIAIELVKGNWEMFLFTASNGLVGHWYILKFYNGNCQRTS